MVHRNILHACSMHGVTTIGETVSDHKNKSRWSDTIMLYTSHIIMAVIIMNAYTAHAVCNLSKLLLLNFVWVGKNVMIIVY